MHQCGWLLIVLGVVVCGLSAPGFGAAAAGGPATKKQVTIIGGPAGYSPAGFSGDGGPATAAHFYQPRSVVLDAHNDIYIADSANNRIRKIDHCTGVIRTVAGNGVAGYSGDGGPATSAALNFPWDVAFDRQGNMYTVTGHDGTLRQIAPDGTIPTVAGGHGFGSSGDGGPAVNARLSGPEGLDVDANGVIYVADYLNHRVRRIDPNGTITNYAGTSQHTTYEKQYTVDGLPAVQAALDETDDVIADNHGNLYISLKSGLVRKVNSAGLISTVLDHDLHEPAHMALDSAGNLYISDGANGVVKLAPNGALSTVVDYHALDSNKNRIYQVEGVAVDPQGNVYTADPVDGHIRKISEPSTRAPKLTVAGAQTQPLLAQHSIRLTVTCDRDCSLNAVGTVRINGATQQFKLAGQATPVSAGMCVRPVNLTLPAQAAKEIRRLGKPGTPAQGQAAVTVRATDNAGHSATVRPTSLSLPDKGPLQHHEWHGLERRYVSVRAQPHARRQEGGQNDRCYNGAGHRPARLGDDPMIEPVTYLNDLFATVASTTASTARVVPSGMATKGHTTPSFVRRLTCFETRASRAAARSSRLHSATSVLGRRRITKTRSKKRARPSNPR